MSIDSFDLGDFRTDGAVKNAIAHLGTRRDVDTHTKPAPWSALRLSDRELEDFYSANVPAQRVCAKIPSQMKAGGLKIESSELDEEGQGSINRFIRTSRILSLLWEASVLASIYNVGAGVVLDVQDSTDQAGWHLPVNKSSIQSVKPLYAVDGRTLRPQRGSGALAKTLNYSFNLPEEPKEGTDIDAEAQLRSSIVQSGLTNVHPDRVLWIDGVFTPPTALQRYGGSISRLQQFWLHYSRYEAAQQAASNLLHRAEIVEIAKKGTTEMLKAAGDAEGRHRLQQQLEIYSMMTNLGVVLTDADRDKVNIIKRSSSAFAPTIKSFREDVIAASGLTEMHLFGLTTVGGGIAGGDLRDRMHMADAVADRQEEEWRNPLEQFFEMTFLAKNGPTNGVEPENWSIKFPNTLRLTPLEEKQIESQEASIAKTYPRPKRIFRSNAMQAIGKDMHARAIQAKRRIRDPKKEASIIFIFFDLQF